MTRAPARLVTGIPGFDAITDGGLVQGRPVLLVGTAGTGKTIFGLQYLATGAREFGEPGVLVTFEEVPEDIVRNAGSFGWDLADLVASGQLVVVDASPDASSDADFDFAALVGELERAVRSTGAKRVVLDSIGALFPAFRDPLVVRKGLRHIVEALRPLGVTTIISAERSEEYGPIARFDVEDFVVDGIVVMRNPLERRTRSRTIEVLKLRGAPHMSGEFPFTIRDQAGIEVIPRPVFELRQAASSKRVTTGNETLDRMCGGGFFTDSVVLVTGSTGTGKTLLGCEFINAAAANGERALYLSFEESRNQLLRNAGSWGIDLAGHDQAGNLRLEFRRPERMLLENLLLEIRGMVDEFEPNRIVVDGMTSLERSSLPDSFREFTVAVVSFMKERNIAVVFTNTDPVGEIETHAIDESHISTMTDGIVVLRYIETPKGLKRGLMVLKMRGTSHDSAVHAYRITDGGLEMGDALSDVVGFIRGAPRSPGE